MISRLNDDDLATIIGHLNPQSEKLLPPENRASLSVESFATGPPQALLDSGDIEKLTRVCRRFKRLGQHRLFRRISVRFSSPGFEILRNIADRPRLAIGVLKFSYMIPRFYSQDRSRFEALLQQFNEPYPSTILQQIERGRNQQAQGFPRTSDSHPLIRRTMAKAEDQRTIINTDSDKNSLLYALSRFEKLGQVRLMRVEDQVDRGWDGFLKRYPQYLDEFKAEDWAQSCEHAASTLSHALLISHNDRPTRFSSRFMDVSSPLVITPTLRTTISRLAPRLRSLDLEFVDVHDEERVLELSELFGAVFRATKQLQCVHVGFRHRVSAPLSLIFHDLYFEEIKHIGLHMWHLDSDELIKLLWRHRSTLRSIRLRHISLKQTLDEKNWEKVLRFIRSTVPNLKWVSLRGIGYDPSLSATTHGMGGLHFAPGIQPYQHMEDDDDSDEGDWPPTEDSDDDADEVAGIQHHEESDNGYANHQHTTDQTEGSVADTEEEEEEDDEHDSDLEEENHDLHFGDSFSADNSILANYPRPPAEQNTTSTTLQCECGNGKYGWYDLDDNGISVVKEQWKEWQKWTVKRCAKHDPRDAV
ncbi:uncharacterized protein PAC_05932 [Phialocephala subalpina]|uniref:Uncharacterized protein n=1 Tax=Phialocephala subalpina TaxID=576137 RepID=A0A1L7WTD9_9HELO|nr:uncharacterized protein PAC_05932 [Phialocephala subalpina]